jgi:hypothetical protein
VMRTLIVMTVIHPQMIIADRLERLLAIVKIFQVQPVRMNALEVRKTVRIMVIELVGIMMEIHVLNGAALHNARADKRAKLGSA